MSQITQTIGPFQGEYAFLSNFYPVQVEFEGIIYPTVEHAFQAARTLDAEERKRIALMPTPGEAKRAGRKVQLREDWEAVKVLVMYRLVYQKFTRHPELRAALLATGDRPIVEINTWGDTFWGVCWGRGQNYLGRILTAVREKLKRQEKAGPGGAPGSTPAAFVEMTGDLWELARGGVLAVTTNGCVDGRGEAVMGRGIALQAKRRFPGVAAKLGRYIQQYGNRCFDLGQFGEYRLVSFPTKHRWDRPADLGLIARSALQIVEMADKFGWPAVYMPRPGCGNGRLSWDQVRPILEPILDGRFVVVSYR